MLAAIQEAKRFLIRLEDLESRVPRRVASFSRAARAEMALAAQTHWRASYEL
jgi:hypothetical protein